MSHHISKLSLCLLSTLISLSLTACSGGNYDDNLNAPVHNNNSTNNNNTTDNNNGTNTDNNGTGNNGTDNNDNNSDNNNNTDNTPKGRKQQIITNTDKEYPKDFGAGDTIILDEYVKSDADLPLTYTASPQRVCKLIGEDKNILQTIKEGTCRLSAKQKGNEEYLPTSNYGEIPVPPKCPAKQRPLHIKNPDNETKHFYTCVPYHVAITPLAYPPTASVGHKFSLKLHGYEIPTDVKLNINMTGCQNLQIERFSITEYDRHIACTPTLIGKQPLTISDSQGNQVFSTIVNVQPDTTISAESTVIKATGATHCITDKEVGIDCKDSSKLGDFNLNQDPQVHAGASLNDYQLIKHAGDTCIKDNATGLTWEQKSNDKGIHDGRWRYLYYNTNGSYNSGNIGIAGDTSLASYCGNTLSLCNSQAYIQALNDANYCGYNDWRLPHTAELFNLVDFGKTTAPMINDLFTNIMHSSDKPKYKETRAEYDSYLTLVNDEGFNFTNGNISYIQKGAKQKRGTLAQLGDSNVYHDSASLAFYPIIAVRNN